MVEEKPRVQKVLESLYEADGSLKPKQIAEQIGESAMNIGKDLYDLSQKRGLAEKLEDGSWQITGQGRDYVESGGQPKTEPKPKPTETTETVPSQSDLFRSIGEKLGVGSRKGDIRLDAIAYYVQRTADLDNLTSVWNALTEMGVATDVRKRWVKLYAQNLPGKQIPEELREKLEGGESERIKSEIGEISAKPKRFSIVGGQVIGDSEGDYNFKEALQLVAQEKGASPNEAGSMALELSKMGPEMLTSLLSAVTPLIKKEPAQSDTDVLVRLTEAGLLKKPGDEDASSPTIRILEMQVKELTDSLRKQEMDTMKGAIISVSNQVGELRKEMANQGRLEGRYGIMQQAITTLDGQLTGLRSDVRPMMDTLARGGGRAPEPRIRTPEEKAKIAKGLKQAVAQEQRAHELEDELLFGKPPPPEVTAETAPAPTP